MPTPAGLFTSWEKNPCDVLEAADLKKKNIDGKRAPKLVGTHMFFSTGNHMISHVHSLIYAGFFKPTFFSRGWCYINDPLFIVKILSKPHHTLSPLLFRKSAK